MHKICYQVGSYFKESTKNHQWIKLTLNSYNAELGRQK